MNLEDLERYDQLIPQNSLWKLVSIDDFGYGTLEFEIHFENIEVLIEIQRSGCIKRIYTNAVPENYKFSNLDPGPDNVLKFNPDAFYQVDDDIERYIFTTNQTQTRQKNQCGNLLTLFEETGGPVLRLKQTSSPIHASLAFESQENVTFEPRQRTIFTTEYK